jgi:PAS domain-containing protein
MVEEQPGEALFALDGAGRCLDANQAALELLGVSLAELRAAPPGHFSIQPRDDGEQSSLRAQWSDGGEELLVGTTGLRRADGLTIRVAYAIEATASGFNARLWRIDGSPHSPTSAFTVGDVLREWRAAERQLTELAPGTRDWARTLGEIEELRGRYQELFDAAQPLFGNAGSVDRPE